MVRIVTEEKTKYNTNSPTDDIIDFYINKISMFSCLYMKALTRGI